MSCTYIGLPNFLLLFSEIPDVVRCEQIFLRMSFTLASPIHLDIVNEVHIGLNVIVSANTHIILTRALCLCKPSDTSV